MAEPNGKPKGSITFISFDKPSITDGVHELSVSQSFSVGNGEIKAAETEKKLKIAAFGPRFSLDPQLVTGKFPPDKSTGDYRTVLPHIIFKRSILPWERKISKDSAYADAPWLALLLFTKNDSYCSQTITLETLCNPPQHKNWQFPTVTLELGQHTTDSLLVIDVPGKLLQKVLPTKEALPYLTHVRQSADQADAPQYPIIISGRLPQAGNETTVHLVSLENRADLFDNIDAHQTYRLVSLTSWSFASTKNTATFKDLLLAANQNDKDKDATATSKNVLRMPTLDSAGNTHSAIINGKINGFYQQGLVPLPHQTRQGNQLVSWYRGPLLPGSGTETVDFAKLNVTAADELVRYDSNFGMFDLSYAAAWELGRLLMLRRRRVSVAFFNWKRARMQASKSVAARHLPFGQPSGSLELPPAVKDWFVGLGRLNDVPYNYLLPDERELPQPSIRFFSIDPAWMAYLLDGAFSIGRVVASKPAFDASLRSTIPIPGPMSGFLLRSPVVAGWPYMEVEGYNVAGGGTTFVPAGVTDANILPLLRMDRIAPDTLLCVFAGELKTVDLNEKAEVIHFGVAHQEGGEGASKTPCYYKVLRDPTTGDEYSVCPATVNVCQSDPGGRWVTVPFINPTSGLIDISQLKDALQTARHKTMAPNLFAFEMVEGVSKVRIVRQQ
jgi:hypothetical protein